MIELPKGSYEIRSEKGRDILVCDDSSLASSRDFFWNNIMGNRDVMTASSEPRIPKGQRRVALRKKRMGTEGGRWRFYLDLRGVGGTYDFSRFLCYWDDPAKIQESLSNYIAAKEWRDEAQEMYLMGKPLLNADRHGA